MTNQQTKTNVLIYYYIGIILVLFFGPQSASTHIWHTFTHRRGGTFQLAWPTRGTGSVSCSSLCWHMARRGNRTSSPMIGGSLLYLLSYNKMQSVYSNIYQSLWWLWAAKEQVLCQWSHLLGPPVPLLHYHTPPKPHWVYDPGTQSSQGHTFHSAGSKTEINMELIVQEKNYRHRENKTDTENLEI